LLRGDWRVFENNEHDLGDRGAAAGGGPALADEMKLPPLKRQKTPQAVVNEHLDALNKCDWNRLMAQYPPQVEIHLPDGVIVKGVKRWVSYLQDSARRGPSRV